MRPFGGLGILGSLAAGEAQGGAVYIHPSTVIYSVATSVGPTSFVFSFTGFYDESLPSDFEDVGAFVKANVEASFELGLDLIDEPLCKKPIKAYVHKELVGTVEPTSPYPCVMTEFLQTRMRLIHDRMRSVMLGRIMDRSEHLDLYSHVFEKLYRESLPGKKYVRDTVHAASIEWPYSGVAFKQEYPPVEFSLETSGIFSEYANFGLMSVYFDWSVLNSAVTERAPIGSKLQDEDDVIIGKAARRRFEKSKLTVQLVINESGSINVSCLKDNAQGHLAVSSRDEKHMRKAGIESPGKVIWRGVHRVCEIILDVL